MGSSVVKYREKMASVQLGIPRFPENHLNSVPGQFDFDAFVSAAT